MENLTIQNVSIQELIDKYAPRKTYRKGSKFFCICPFPEHIELTPSFFFKENTFHCFGCGKSGGALDFVKILYNITEEEAFAKIIDDFKNNGD